MIVLRTASSRHPFAFAIIPDVARDFGALELATSAITHFAFATGIGFQFFAIGVDFAVVFAL